MTVKTITIKKRGGGTRQQKVQVLASGKFKFIKNSSKRVAKKVKRKSRTSRRVLAKSRRTVTKVIRKSSPRKTMAKKKRGSKKTSTSNVMSKVKRFAKPVVIGLGVSAGLAIAGNAVGQPQIAQNPLVKVGTAFVLGGPIAAGATLLLGGGLGNLLGGNGSTGGRMV